MPPLYPLFLYAVKIFFTNTEIFYGLSIYSNFICAHFYLFCHKIFKFFSEKLSLMNFNIYDFPLNIAPVSQFFYIHAKILLINVFFLLRLFRKLDYKYIFMFSISSGFLMLLRKFFIFVILSTFTLS